MFNMNVQPKSFDTFYGLYALRGIYMNILKKAFINFPQNYS